MHPDVAAGTSESVSVLLSDFHSEDKDILFVCYFNVKQMWSQQHTAQQSTSKNV